MARSLHLRFCLCTTSDSHPGPGGSRTAASCQPWAWRPSAIPLQHRRPSNPSAEPTILHSKGRITYLPSFSVILGAQTKLRTCTSPLIAIALQTSTIIVYPILWRRQLQLCLNTVRRVDCHLSQESSPTSPPWPATLGRDNVKPNNRRKTQEQPTQPASTPTAPPPETEEFVFFFSPGRRGERGWQRWGSSDTVCGQLSLNPVRPYRYTQSPSPLLTALCQAL